MGKGLEELKRLAYENACCRCQYYTDNKCTNKDTCVWLEIETALKDYERRLKLAKEYEDVNKVGKRLKAFEIIKEKRVDITTLMDCDNAEEYNRWVPIRSHYTYQPLEVTQEEFDLLKEMLL